MIRLAIALSLAVLIGLAYHVYQGATLTRQREAELAQIKTQIVEEAAKIRVLKADWAMLNAPDRLHRLATQHLALSATVPQQFVQFANFANRPGTKIAGQGAGALTRPAHVNRAVQTTH
ncbi:MAG TPA: hypothetical protein DCL54_17625 [Alphaproteobacteria bacterium]|nr:hypothetical protein [Alphaproteobacteria bacterium]HAJ48398.1 hypothetical protein [Alphaproteobacteria bacterium]